MLINSDGVYRLCDFGSCTRDHKIFASPAELAQLEEQVQKFTTGTVLVVFCFGLVFYFIFCFEIYQLAIDAALVCMSRFD